ncbi:BREX system serine/threonine kinase PglW [Microbispora sp. NBC_01389]|uniref:BREX system serine/threonine kinase PglW n=1 Tax=Microbispora sp. NBC_01389 TaxID=2903584 RepID=UPI00324A68EC
MDEGRWVTVTPSQFQHERDALEYVRRLLPEAEPYRAWSNFTFTADTGHVREVDLLVAAPSGLHLIEIKSLHGRLTASGSNWIQRNPSGSGTRTFDNPLHLADSKAKQLKTLLQRAASKRGVREHIPFIQAAVFLSVPSLQIQLPDHHLHGIYGTEGQENLPEIWEDLLRRPPQDDRRRLTPTLSRQLTTLLEDVGIARSRRHLQVGSWQLETRPFDVGPTWQDHHAEHSQLKSEKRRIRIYLVERNADQAMRASIERAARREMLVLHGISHPGIVQVDTMEPHEAGPALIFRHHPKAMRLDHYLAQYGESLDLDARLGMVRQLAEAVSYAHRRRLYHRALSARSILVTPARGREAGWLRPQVQISDWQTATRGADSAGSTGEAMVLSSITSHAGEHIEASAQAYLAPELSAPNPDPVAMDVFGLGALSYLLLTGQPPADTRTELFTRLSKENGLRPSTVADSITEFMDEMVQAATAPVPTQRLATVAEFLEMLELVEDEATAPETAHPEDEAVPAAEEPDPLDARPGDVIDSTWRIEKRLGTGSTSRAFLAENLDSGRKEVLKVALSDEKASRLEHEASVLSRLGSDSRVIRLARDEPLRVGGRTFIVLDHAGEHTVARKIREDGRLSPDELEVFSEYLFGAVDFLEGEGVTHRDIKPDNIAIRIRPNRTRQLVLFDFSLAGISVKDIQAGTPGYLDPFLGTASRQVYDAHAERYAVAVTLHEMASGELPEWGDGKTEARFTEGPPTLAVEAFDPAIRDGLVEFFQRALHRDAKKRFDTLKEMMTAWRIVFQRSDAAPPVGSDHPDDTAGRGTLPAEDDAPQKARDKAAEAATRATVLDAAGLTQRAVSAAARLEATTVGDLLDLPSKALFNLPGLGAKTRQELQRRIRDWRARLGENEMSPLATAEKKAAKAETTHATAGTEEESQAFSRVGLDIIASLLVPDLLANRRNATEVDATRLLLGLPSPAGDPSPLPPWPQQPQVAMELRPQVTSGRIAQIMVKQRARWRDEPLVRSVLDEVITLLAGSGRVMGAAELAESILARRGSARTGSTLRRAIAMAAVRAAVEIDPVQGEPRLITRRHRDRIMVALEATESDAPDTPAGPALLDYADALGKAADRLAAQEVLPTAATVLRELRAVKVPGAEVILDDRRLVFLAATSSDRAAATARLEIYPRDLSPVRALRLTQAGVVPAVMRDGRPLGLTPEQIHEKVRARFPALQPLPNHPKLDALLRDAGFDVRWRVDRYVSPQAEEASTGRPLTRRATRTGSSRWNAETPELAEALRTEERLRVSADAALAAGGFRALTVQLSLYGRARGELVSRFGARPVSLAKLFLHAMQEQVTPGKRPTWETILDADIAAPNSKAAFKLREYADQAWQLVAHRLAALVEKGAEQQAGGPLLVYDAAPLARYDAGDLLFDLAAGARQGDTPVWLLCPMNNPGHQPRLDGMLVPAQLPNEWIVLPDAWVANQHRSGAKAS